jgi:hypothetical protein
MSDNKTITLLLDKIKKLEEEIRALKQYALELDREAQTGETHDNLQHDNDLQRD